MGLFTAFFPRCLPLGPVYLYLLLSLTFICPNLPQIVHLMKEHCTAGLSLAAYVFWVVAAVLLLSYAVSMRDAVCISL